MNDKAKNIASTRCEVEIREILQLANQYVMRFMLITLANKSVRIARAKNGKIIFIFLRLADRAFSNSPVL